jgi:hypothetical protein
MHAAQRVRGPEGGQREKKGGRRRGVREWERIPRGAREVGAGVHRLSVNDPRKERERTDSTGNGEAPRLSRAHKSAHIVTLSPARRRRCPLASPLMSASEHASSSGPLSSPASSVRQRGSADAAASAPRPPSALGRTLGQWQGVIDALRDIIAGTIGGIAGRLVEYPFDTVKTKMQAASLGASRARPKREGRPASHAQQQERRRLGRRRAGVCALAARAYWRALTYIFLWLRALPLSRSRFSRLLCKVPRQRALPDGHAAEGGPGGALPRHGEAGGHALLVLATIAASGALAPLPASPPLLPFPPPSPTPRRPRRCWARCLRRRRCFS